MQDSFLRATTAQAVYTSKYKDRNRYDARLQAMGADRCWSARDKKKDRCWSTLDKKKVRAAEDNMTALHACARRSIQERHDRAHVTGVASLTAPPRRASACRRQHCIPAHASEETSHNSSNQFKYDRASVSDFRMTKFSTLFVSELRVKLHEPPRYTSPAQSQVFACMLAKPPAGGLWVFTTAPHSLRSFTRASWWEQDGFLC